MTSASLYLKDPLASRFVAGGLAEAEALLGSPLPLLPAPEDESGRRTYWVKFHPRVHTLLQRFLQGLLGQIGGDPGARSRGDGGAKDQDEYEAALLRMLRSARMADRRLGLLNLCWLAHSRAVAECLREMESKSTQIRRLKYSLHPLLSSFYKRVDQASRREVEQAAPGQTSFLAGGDENTSLVDSIIEDGFAFTELSSSHLDFNQFLGWNKRYRISPDVFFEIYSILSRETERRLREGDRGLLSRVGRHLPGLPKEHCLTPSGAAKVMMNVHVMNYVLADAWGTGSKLMASAKIKSECERRRPSEVMDVFLDLIAGVKRFEVVSHVRDQVCLIQPFGGEREHEDKVSKGYRIYEFGESSQVVNNAVNATVLFLDLRGFTQTSEGQISERDLTRELYAVFDAFVACITRFGGTVDKFLGDGIMVTYGATRADPLHPLNALRSAILCQETLAKLRAAGKTYFKMGISVHYGRVYLARFVADDQTVQNTVIGRNVNLAGRLSSAAKRPMDDDIEEGPVPVASPRRSNLQVTVDESGTLFNEGIAISRDTLVQLESRLALVHLPDGDSSVMEYFDEQIGRKMLFRYAGDAKFKGVRSSFPVYEVDFET
jgi:class 3 adenylate cyclase